MRMAEQCSNCKYFVLDEDENGKYGYCTIEVPAYTPYSHGVNKDYWCDEWVSEGE